MLKRDDSMRTLYQCHQGERRFIRALAATMIGLVVACSPQDLVGSAPLPSDLSDPAATHTPAGALSAYRGTLAQFRDAFGGPNGSFIETAGLLSDELQNGNVGSEFNGSGLGAEEDQRLLPESTNPQTEIAWYVTTYARLNTVRGQAREALGLLRDFPPTAAPALRGHLYALQGYSEMQLADLFCSGIPLSTLDYNGDYSLESGSTTAAVYQHAIALFDTALTLSSDSARILNLARIGRARALLALGQYSDAAAAVAEVPEGYRYEVSYTTTSGANATNFAWIQPGVTWEVTVGDHEGGNGLDFRSSGDPRTAVSDVGQTLSGVTLFHPNRYSTDGSSSIVLADWVEAQLIEAEAALQAGQTGTWLTTLNHLRETAISPALPDTIDPGTPDSRVDLLFRERAFWLFLSGHRQGDLRRMIRQYGRFSTQTYPTGSFDSAIGLLYGSDVTAPIPATERTLNSKFTGCINRGA
jgi:tetratricopeptide (TPR) repeat protein